jgi:hypothetical protein
MFTISIALASRNTSYSLDQWWDRSHFSFTLLIIFHFSFLISTCGLDVEDSTPPSPPTWVQKSLPEEWPERGIDAHESSGIILEWERNPETQNVAEYQLYCAEVWSHLDSIGNFEPLAIVQSSGGLKLEYIDRRFILNKPLLYMLKAKDFSGNISDCSDTLSYQRLSAVSLQTMTPNGQDETLGNHRRLAWSYNDNIAMEEYCITMLDADNVLIARQVFTPGTYIGGREYWTIPNDKILEHNTVYKWRIDMNGQYRNGIELAGSESQWATFRYFK